MPAYDEATTSGADTLVIEPAHLDPALTAVRALFRQYAASLKVDLGYQDFDAELAQLPGVYAPPAGCLLLCRVGELPAGCVSLRRIHENVGEMKRLFAHPQSRGRSIGRRLSEAVITRAKDAGLSGLRLDTLSDMASAQALYRRLGFVDIAPYYDSPVAGTCFMELDLSR
jgi:ribosomal protein S18 acetylase RimI-like enzyme